MTQRVPILVYHHVYEDGHPELRPPSREKATGVIGRSEFLRQMSYVQDGGWTVVATSRIVDWLGGGQDLPARSLAVHFDNGWLDARTVALPILEHLGTTATSFIISDATEAASRGELAAVQTSTEGAVQKPFVTWEHARELLDAGWEIGAHSATHPKFAELHAEGGDDAVLAEVERSNGLFAQRLGFVPSHFAYPSGSRNERTDALVAPHYRSLRLWRYSHPPQWTFTDRNTSPTALECQNVDSTVAFEDFTRIFAEALEG